MVYNSFIHITWLPTSSLWQVPTEGAAAVFVPVSVSSSPHSCGSLHPPHLLSFSREGMIWNRGRMQRQRHTQAAPPLGLTTYYWKGAR
ncbi:hypothetical protein GDO81_026023 [Engystomops pustulosus]|uniref:Uncharacterized protein n=1 Tax=Engystomops pustulosus TaxID=76066 RepID=A0AAV6YS79_ENGPU|nr:hypothetical protein GDO81_026023 [Engystomops pustulosus]